jgi:Fe2+ or Zn2+ uptake regulation protein
VNLSTVHRAVQTLTERGVLHAVHVPGAALYGATGRPHLHAVCTTRGTLREFTEPTARGSGALARLTAVSGLDAAGPTTLAVYGRCEHCPAV